MTRRGKALDRADAARTHAYIRFTDTVFYFTPSRPALPYHTLLCFALLCLTLLCFACPANPPAAVSWLLSGGGGIISGDAIVDVNCTNEDGWTPLHLASRFGKVTVVEALLAAGANVNCKDNKGRTALDRASGYAVTRALQGGGFLLW